MKDDAKNRFHERPAVHEHQQPRAAVFNAGKAYLDNNDILITPHNNGGNTKEVTFFYTVRESSICLFNKGYSLRLIIADQLINRL